MILYTYKYILDICDTAKNDLVIGCTMPNFSLMDKKLPPDGEETNTIQIQCVKKKEMCDLLTLKM